MQKEYITEYNGEFNVTKFTLSTGTEVYLSEDEQEELLSGLDKYIELENDNRSLGEELDSQNNIISEQQEDIDDLSSEVSTESMKVLGLETKLEHKQEIIDSYLAFQDLIKSERR